MRRSISIALSALKNAIVRWHVQLQDHRLSDLMLYCRTHEVVLVMHTVLLISDGLSPEPRPESDNTTRVTVEICQVDNILTEKADMFAEQH